MALLASGLKSLNQGGPWFQSDALLSVALQNTVLKRSATAALYLADRGASAPVPRPAPAAGLATGMAGVRVVLRVLVGRIGVLAVVVAVLGFVATARKVAPTRAHAAPPLATRCVATAGAVAVLTGRRSDHKTNLRRDGEQHE
jgi:hypothetical protein